MSADVTPPMSQRERVALLSTRLLTTEAARRKAVLDGNQKLHNDLANMNREALAVVSPADLRSLVTCWLFRLADAAEPETAEQQGGINRG